MMHFLLSVILLIIPWIPSEQSDFEKLKDSYPNKKYTDDPDKDRQYLFEKVLKGDWPKLASNPNYYNTCAVRMSIALNKMGGKFKIPSGYPSNHKDGSGNNILTTVPDIKTHHLKSLGQQYWGYSKTAGESFPLHLIPKEKGIVLYVFNLPYVNGHVDVWGISSCLYSCPTDDVDGAAEIMFWKID